MISNVATPTAASIYQAMKSEVQIRTFPTTDSALDWRTDSTANDGDVMVIESEEVVAVACPFDFAVTVKRGKMSEFLIDQPTYAKDFLQLVISVRCAVAEANRLGYAVVPELSCIQTLS